MDLNRYTNKAQQALMKAQNIAAENNHNTIEPVHLLLAMLQQDDGVVPQIVQKIGAAVPALARDLEGLLERLPRITGNTNVSTSLSRASMQVFTAAEAHAKKMKDDYISTEHVFLALADSRELGAVLQKRGIMGDAILQALASIRGGQRVTSPRPGGDVSEPGKIWP